MSPTRDGVARGTDAARSAQPRGAVGAGSDPALACRSRKASQPLTARVWSIATSSLRTSFSSPMAASRSSTSAWPSWSGVRSARTRRPTPRRSPGPRGRRRPRHRRLHGAGQVRGQATDHRADIFALGCVLHEMLSGERAFRGDTPVDTLSAILSQEPPSLSGLGKDIRRPVADLCPLLEKRPENRFSSAHDLALALQASVSGTEAVSLPSVASPRRRRWAVMAAVAAGLVAVVAVGAWLLGRGDGGNCCCARPREGARRPLREPDR